ncbi:uncharacterized protein LOC130014941 [Mercurialis annua]|uniref:uncharacterized protein LOC130014941 n=1 Tax=Mercurialis annua TaxID=3986 RepID=UPI0024AF9853|nr:uncharacterized protein LOC130014941 [Mercurialis annua]
MVSTRSTPTKEKKDFVVPVKMKRKLVKKAEKDVEGSGVASASENVKVKGKKVDETGLKKRRLAFDAVPDHQKVQKSLHIEEPTRLVQICVFLGSKICVFHFNSFQLIVKYDLPEQQFNDCGVFAFSFAEYIVHGREQELTKEFDVNSHRKRLAFCLYKYGKWKNMFHVVSESESYQDKDQKDGNVKAKRYKIRAGKLKL